MKPLDTDLDPRERHNFYRALSRLKNNSDFQSVSLVFELFINKLDEDNRRADGVPLYRGQGAALLVAEFLACIRDAEDLARKTEAK